MQISIHNDAVAMSFSEATGSYEQWADPQRRSARCLMKRLPKKGHISSILDVGCGTGYMVELFHERFSEVYIDAVVGAGLKLLLAKKEAVQGFYKSGLDVLRSLKGVGATFKHHRGYSPRSASEVQEIAQYYESRYRLADGRVPITYQILYLVAESVQ